MVERGQVVNIVKPKSDKGLYKLIHLSNKMRCLLRHDEETETSAASLSVHVGCSLDPKEFYGTAHFLEHMLFMGTEKYPDENEYSEYIKNKSGIKNAFTSLTDTNYYFEVSNEGFERALDMFSQFFISPLLGENQAEREMKAVDSEFNMHQQSDVRRRFMILQTLSHPDSKFNRFNCGNLKSLQKEGIRDALLSFHKQWYSSNIMDLVVSSKHSLEQLEAWVTEKFTAVPNKDLKVPDLGQPSHPFPPERLGVITKFHPTQDQEYL